MSQSTRRSCWFLDEVQHQTSANCPDLPGRKTAIYRFVQGPVYQHVNGLHVRSERLAQIRRVFDTPIAASPSANTVGKRIWKPVTFRRSLV